jgi:hypothetical protein
MTKSGEITSQQPSIPSKPTASPNHEEGDQVSQLSIEDDAD